MNERIRELAKEAAREMNETGTYSEPKFQEKFAELIVQECMTMCDNVSADYFKHRKAADDFRDKNIYAEGESACDEVRYEIKKHFGVEE
jgi:DNA-binding ferritin-like protein